MNSVIAQCGHVKRRLANRERLTGKVLDFAIGVIEDSRHRRSDDELLRWMKAKLLLGDQLDDYEMHLMLDVLLLHKRLGAGNVILATVGH